MRSLLLELIKQTPPSHTLRPVYFDGFQYRVANRFLAKFLSRSKQEQKAAMKVAYDEVAEFNQDDIYLGLDLNPAVTHTHQAMYQHWQALGVRVYFVVYDLLLVQRPDWAPALASAAMKNWMSSVTQVANGLICISEAVANEVRDWLAEHPPKRLSGPSVSFFHLGADLSNSAPSQGMPRNADRTLKLLCSKQSFLSVGTLEPRKGQRQTLAAFELLWTQGVDVNLVLIGKKGWMMDDLVHHMQQHAEFGKRLFWLDGISDEYLKQIYSVSASLIAASEGEGFGLPLIEAASHKLPILVRDLPVFREVAGNHALYFTGLEPKDLADAVLTWRDLKAQNTAPDSAHMPHLTWAQSTQQLLPLIFC